MADAFKTVSQLKKINDRHRFHVTYLMIQEARPDLSEYKQDLVKIIASLPVAIEIVSAHNDIHSGSCVLSNRFYDVDSTARIQELWSSYDKNKEMFAKNANENIANDDFFKIYRLIDTSLAILKDFDQNA